MRSFIPLCLTTLLGTLSYAAAVPAAVSEVAVRQDSDLPRLVIYFQTTHDANGNPISMLPLIDEQGIALTHLIVCSFHVNAGSDLTLNDATPEDPSFFQLWNETVVMQNAGVKVMGMVGGAAAGSFTTETLDGDDDTFETYYAQLSGVISMYNLQGMDLDVEQPMSQSGITRLVERLHADFGSDFLVTLAPVGSAMSEGSNLSGFDYKTLDSTDGPDIAFYNVQYYDGFGDLSTPADYEATINAGYDVSKVVAGQLTAGGTPFDSLNATVISLVQEYGQIGGIMGFEYFNSDPGGTAAPWEWAQEMTEILRPGMVPDLTLSSDDAKRLETARDASRTAPQPDSSIKVGPKVNYKAMVNA